MRIPILGYHKVGPVAEYGRRLNIEATRLESHVRYFARRHYQFLTAQQLSGPWPSRGIVFTFDDGFKGAVEDGLPCLERHQAVGTVYVVTDLVGKSAAWEGEEPFALADWDSLRAAARTGHEIGNHTRSHARLGELGSEAQIEQIRSAGEALAREGLSGGSFCLPYGSYAPTTAKVLADCDVSICMSIHKGIARESDDRLLLPRVFVAYGDSLPLLLYRLYVRPLLPKKRK